MGSQKVTVDGLADAVKRIAAKTFIESFAQFAADENVQLIAVPNKKSSIFSRLFNPSIAHRVLFQTDTPMLVVPV